MGANEQPQNNLISLLFPPTNLYKINIAKTYNEPA